MSDRLEFLERLLDAPGPSGFEARAARVWRDEAEGIADAVETDVTGNSLAILNPDGRPRVMLAGHIDEIGLQVTHGPSSSSMRSVVGTPRFLWASG